MPWKVGSGFNRGRETKNEEEKGSRERGLRESIVDTLKIIASKRAQIEYEKNVPIANVPAELACMWFDDLYHPKAYLFLESFSEEERAVLAKFNAFYEARLDSLPKTLKELHKSSEWNEVCEKANEVLSELRPLGSSSGSVSRRRSH